MPPTRIHQSTRKHSEGKPHQIPNQKKPSGKAPVPMSRRNPIGKSAGPRRLTKEELAQKLKEGMDLSTKSNDRIEPLDTPKFILPGCTAMTRDSRDEDFCLDFSHYLNIVRSSYVTIGMLDRGLHKYMSLSMYEYYCTILLWYKICHVLSERGEFIEDLLSFDRLMSPVKTAIPKDIQRYLSGIGNIVDHSDKKVYLRLLLHLCEETLIDKVAMGTYGKVNATTHTAYETLPAPFISLRRIIEDLRKTRNPRATADWDLDTSIKPDGVFKPTANLLGWLPAKRLTEEQVGLLESAGFDYQDNTVSYGSIKNVLGIPIQLSLLEKISGVLHGSKASIVDGYDITTFNGSMAQVPYTIISPSDFENDRNKILTARCASAKNLYQISSVLLSGATGFRLRVKRNYGSCPYIWSCYVDDTGNVPPGFEATANDAYDHCPSEWNLTGFTGPLVIGSTVASNISRLEYGFDAKE